MRVRLAVPFVLLLAAFLPASSAAVPCSPLDCGPQATTVAAGRALALVSHGPLKLYDLGSGKRRARSSSTRCSRRTAVGPSRTPEAGVCS